MNNNESLAHTNGPQNGPGEFAQLDGLFCGTFRRGEPLRGVRCSAGGKTGSAKPQLDGLENGAAFRTRRIRHRKTLLLPWVLWGPKCPHRRN